MKRYLTDRGLAGSIGKAAQQFCIQTRSPETISTKLRAIYSECATSAFGWHDR
jgi:hypothetical protein